MPRLFLPSRSIDKTAALSLYRALLQQCRTLETSPTQASLRNVVHNKFQDNRAIVGVKTVRDAFEAGYEALNLLTKCNNTGHEGTTQLLGLLERVPALLKKKKTKRPTSTSPPSSTQTSTTALPPPTPTLPPTTPPTSPQPTAPNTNTPTPTPTILHRPHPLPSTTPRRRIPTWVEANGIPFLRTRKPIPHALSGYLNKRIQRRQSRTDTINYFNQFSMRLAQDEDIWDGIVRSFGAEEGFVVREENVAGTVESGAGHETGRGKKRGKKGDNVVKFVGKKTTARLDRQREGLIKKVEWDWSVRAIVEGLWTQVRAEKARNLWWSGKFKEVVEREKAMAVVEKREWERKRRREKRIAKGLAKRVKEGEARACDEKEEEKSV